MLTNMGEQTVSRVVDWGLYGDKGSRFRVHADCFFRMTVEKREIYISYDCIQRQIKGQEFSNCVLLRWKL